MKGDDEVGILQLFAKVWLSDLHNAASQPNLANIYLPLTRVNTAIGSTIPTPPHTHAYTYTHEHAHAHTHLVILEDIGWSKEDMQTLLN